MNTTKNSIALEFLSTFMPENSIALKINPNKTVGNNRPNYSLLLAKFFTLFLLGMVLFSACKKELDVLPSASTANMNDTLLKAGAPTFYIAPTGSDVTGDGTYLKPYLTLNKAWSKVTAGGTIYLRGGTYRYSTYQALDNKSGTAGNMIKIWAYPGETPVITQTAGFSASRGIENYNANYIHFKGLEITGFKQRISTSFVHGLISQNSNNNIYENLKIHDNGFGLAITGTGGGNLVLNCDFYRNQDPLTNVGGMSAYGGADGVTIRTSDPTETNTIRGCRMWWNSDDGVDLYGNAGTIREENCWSFWNGFIPGTFTAAGNGMGFKYGPIYGGTTQIRRVSHNLLSFENRMDGYDQGSDGTNFPTEMYNCIAYKNGVIAKGVGFGFNQRTVPVNLFRNNISYANGGSAVRLNAVSINDHNSWNGGVTVTNADFISVSSVGMDRARGADWSLPVTNFLKLATGSDLINKGVNVGLPYLVVPDLGAFESK